MTTSSDVRDRLGLDDGWTVRFTADRTRASDVAEGYRRAGYDVRVVALAPDDQDLDLETVEAFDDATDPVAKLRDEECVSCLEDVYVVVTRRGDAGDAAVDLVYE